MAMVLSIQLVSRNMQAQQFQAYGQYNQGAQDWLAEYVQHPEYYGKQIFLLLKKI